MEKEFWDVLSSHPFFVIIVIVGGLLAIATLLNAFEKVHIILGYKTRAEVEQHDYEENEKRRDKQIDDMWKEIKDMREESRTYFKTLEEDMKNVKKANIVVLGDRISQKSSHYLQIGCIPAEEVLEYQGMYEAYKSIGGNHGIDKIFEKTVAALPLVSKEEQ